MKGVFLLKDNDKRLWVQTLWNPINDKHQSPLESKKPGIKVAAYCRVSISEEEQLKSLENQVHHYTITLKANPIGDLLVSTMIKV